MHATVLLVVSLLWCGSSQPCSHITDRDESLSMAAANLSCNQVSVQCSFNTTGDGQCHVVSIARTGSPGIAVQVVGTTDLKVLSFPALLSVSVSFGNGLAFDIEKNYALTSISLPLLSTISLIGGGEGVYVMGNPVLQSVAAPSWSTIVFSGQVIAAIATDMFDNPLLSLVDFRSLSSFFVPTDAYGFFAFGIFCDRVCCADLSHTTNFTQSQVTISHFDAPRGSLIISQLPKSDLNVTGGAVQRSTGHCPLHGTPRNF
jgi:hypothetical protein